MANFIQKAIKHPGALHKELGVPQGEKIPAGKLEAAAKKGGKLGQRARFAETLKGLHHGGESNQKIMGDGEMGGMGDQGPVPDAQANPTGTKSTNSNMLNEKLKRLKKRGQPSSLDEIKQMAKAKGYKKAEYSY